MKARNQKFKLKREYNIILQKNIFAVEYRHRTKYHR